MEKRAPERNGEQGVFLQIGQDSLSSKLAHAFPSEQGGPFEDMTSKPNLPARACMAIFAALLPLGADARIGETEAECAARYGEPERKAETGDWPPGSHGQWYRKGGLIILVGYHDGKADIIVYQNTKEDLMGKPAELSAMEIDALLKANGGKSRWKAALAPSMDDVWRTEDGKFIAHRSWLSRYLMIATQEADQRQARLTEERQRAAAKTRLEGL